ncbi:hypothetical protein SF83666_b60270 (plasmid) [Sinorhizobium fredii CCBAU 83666]|nr:hypothetical protein SF83666_b60270 [Sinorhizobium fredii CCBAU 83666]
MRQSLPSARHRRLIIAALLFGAVAGKPLPMSSNAANS